MNTIRRDLAALATLLILIAGCTGQPAPSGSVASVAGSPGVVACNEGTRTTAGTYRLSAADTFSVPATVTIADGWHGCGLLAKEFGEPGGPAIIGFWSVENVYANPCHWEGALTDPPVGPTADELVNALVEQEVTETSTPSATTLGGDPATYVSLRVPEEADVADCDRVEIAEFRFWKEPGEERVGSAVWWIGAADAPGLIGEVWALDLDDTRAVVQAAYYADALAAEVDEIHQIVESIIFEP